MTYTATAVRAAKSASRATDSDRIEALIADHMKLVRKLAWHVHGHMSSSVELEELIQTGMVALIESARAFEDQGFAFATYAATRIRGSMIDALRRASPQSRKASANRRAIIAARQSVESKVGRTATPQELAAEMNLTLGEFQDVELTARSITNISIESAYSDHDCAFQDEAPASDEVLDEGRLKSLLLSAIDELPEREKMILQFYFYEEMNLDEIGKILGITAGRVCQMKAAALGQLRSKNVGREIDFF